MRTTKDRAEFIYWKRPWHKWAVLVGALSQLLCLWMNIQEYNNISRVGILSAAEWANYALEKGWQCGMNGILAACVLGVFLLGIFSRSPKGARLAEGLLLLLLALAWGAAGVALRWFSSTRTGLFWVLILITTVGGAAYSFWGRK